MIVEPEAITAEQTAAWRGDGFQAAAVVLDDRHETTAYRRAAQMLAARGSTLITGLRWPGMSRASSQCGSRRLKEFLAEAIPTLGASRRFEYNDGRPLSGAAGRSNRRFID